MAGYYHLNNVSATQLGPKSWKVTFNKRHEGKQWKKSKIFKGNRREVQAFLSDFREKWEREMTAKNCGRDIKNMDISGLLDKWLKATGKDNIANHSTPKQYTCCMSMIKKLKETCGKVKIYPGDSRPYFERFHNEFRIKLNEWKVEKVSAHMVNKKTSTPYKTLSNTTIYTRIKYLRRAFELLLNDDIIPRNPMDNALYKAIKPNPPRKGNFGEVDDPTILLEAIAKHRPHIFFVTWYAFLVPSRKSELVKVEKKYLDLKRKRLVIPANLSKTGSKIFKDLPDCMMDYFKSIPKESKFVFYRKIGGTKRRPKVDYVSLGDFKSAWNTCCKLVNFERNVFHDTRHWAATTAEKMGVATPTILKNAGWKSPRMMDRYRTLNPEGEGEIIKLSEIKNLITFPNAGGREPLAGTFGKINENSKAMGE